MKKIIYLILLLQTTYLLSDTKKDPHFSGAITAGYVFKTDSRFREVYGVGAVDAITADACYYFYHGLGVGAKVSYWQKHGKTTFVNLRTKLQEIPLTFYLRKIHYLNCGLGLYASLGGGVVWLKEKSYLGTTKFNKGIGEAEIGLNYNIWRCIGVTGAFRYLFPQQSRHAGTKIEAGGLELRAGIQFSF